MLDSVKMAWGCPCGYAAIPEALHFHHRDPDSKYRWPGRSRSLYNLGMSSLLAEIAKCDVLCANCHAEVTHG